MRKGLLILFALCLVAVGCTKGKKMDGEVAASTRVMLKVGGKTVYTADDFRSQDSVQGTAFRSGNDDMTSYMSVSLNAWPSAVGQSLQADLGWKHDGAAETRPGVSFSVQKIEGDLVWLWSSSDKIGAVIRTLQ